MSKYASQITVAWLCAAIPFFGAAHALLNGDTTNALLLLILANQVHADHEKALAARNAQRKATP